MRVVAPELSAGSNRLCLVRGCGEVVLTGRVSATILVSQADF